MIHSLVTIIRVVAVLGCVSSAIYYLGCMWSAAAFLRGRKVKEAAHRTPELPPVSILKPLRGTDPEIYECFRSHCAQEYSEYEIIFGVSDAQDPAIESVERLRREFPRAQIHLLVCPKVLGTNRKVSNLAQMIGEARYEHLIVNDSDIRVEPDYLQRVVSPLLEEKNGMVTCFYRGKDASTLGSRLESLGISSDFCPGVLAANLLEGGLHFGLGSTLAFRRSTLGRIGGFEAIVDYLADDYELGKRIADLGLNVHLSDVVVDTHLPPYSLSQFLSHQLRWARGMKDSRPGGYFGLIATFGLLWAVVAVAASAGAWWAWALLAIIASLRFLLAAYVEKKVLHGRNVWQNAWLLPLRDLFAAGVWLASFCGNTVTWRGDRFQLKDGKLIHIST